MSEACHIPSLLFRHSGRKLCLQGAASRRGARLLRRPFRKARLPRQPSQALGHGKFTRISRTCCEGPFAEVLRATGLACGANPFRFSTKYQDEETDLFYYGYRYYSASRGRWVSWHPLADKAFLDSAVREVSTRRAKQLRVESLMPVYGFVRNRPVERIDADGRAPVVPILIGVGVCCAIGVVDAFACALHMSDIQNEATEAANAQMEALDPNYDPDRNGPDHEGTNADALRHCIGSCRANQSPGPCLCAAFVRSRIQARENAPGLGHEMDRFNNAVGFGITGDCVVGCVAALEAGKLRGFTNGNTTLSPIHVP